VPQLPNFYLTRDFGLAAYGVLALWAVNSLRLRLGLGFTDSRTAGQGEALATAA
jgi:hypothetical protein